MLKQRDPAREALADAKELNALRELASDAFELRSAVIAMETIDRAVMRLTVFPDLHRDGFDVYCLNSEEQAARQYALHHVGDLARQLLSAFDGITEERRAA